MVNDDPDTEVGTGGEGAEDTTLGGKIAFQRTIMNAANNPDVFLQRARAQAAPYQVSQSSTAAFLLPHGVAAQSKVGRGGEDWSIGVAHTSKTRLVGRARNPRVGRRWQCYHTRGGTGGGSGDCGGGY
ncbi:hypothetical protein [Sodalis sp.]|uniref:hypothetical protein n=1 Tax=Sodalis sp. (in: enterobacteria) TaxID=1898979 RepID=UPI00387365E9